MTYNALTSSVESLNKQQSARSVEAKIIKGKIVKNLSKEIVNTAKDIYDLHAHTDIVRLDLEVTKKKIESVTSQKSISSKDHSVDYTISTNSDVSDNLVIEPLLSNSKQEILTQTNLYSNIPTKSAISQDTEPIKLISQPPNKSLETPNESLASHKSTSTKNLPVDYSSNRVSDISDNSVIEPLLSKSNQKILTQTNLDSNLPIGSAIIKDTEPIKLISQPPNKSLETPNESLASHKSTSTKNLPVDYSSNKISDISDNLVTEPLLSKSKQEILTQTNLYSNIPTRSAISQDTEPIKLISQPPNVKSLEIPNESLASHKSTSTKNLPVDYSSNKISDISDNLVTEPLLSKSKQEILTQTNLYSNIPTRSAISQDTEPIKQTSQASNVNTIAPPIINELIPNQESSNISLSKLASNREFEGDLKPQPASSTVNVHEDSSLDPLPKSLAEVELLKRSKRSAAPDVDYTSINDVSNLEPIQGTELREKTSQASNVNMIAPPVVEAPNESLSSQKSSSTKDTLVEDTSNTVKSLTYQEEDSTKDPLIEDTSNTVKSPAYQEEDSTKDPLIEDTSNTAKSPTYQEEDSTKNPLIEDTSNTAKSPTYQEEDSTKDPLIEDTSNTVKSPTYQEEDSTKDPLVEDTSNTIESPTYQEEDSTKDPLVEDTSSNNIPTGTVISSVVHEIVHRGLVARLNKLFQVVIAAGDEEDRIQKGLWIDILYGTSKQGSLQNIIGYNNHSYGATIGFNAELDTSLIGIAYSNLSSIFKYRTNKNADKAFIKNHIISLYGQKNLSDRFLLQGVFSMSRNYIIHKFVNSLSNSNLINKFKNNSFHIETILNYNIPTNKKFTLIPNIGIRYDQYLDIISTDTPTVAVSNKLQNIFAGILGTRVVFSPKHLSESMTITPELSGSIMYSLNSKGHKVNISQVGSNNVQHIIVPTQPRISYNLGTSLVVEKQNTKVVLQYNCQLRKKYQSQQIIFSILIKM
ncbi:autotransporter outer membrane beta-barrel domain-containing protein [Candidatus Tisiphia endosymbiont of Micropterix aruncella]|uniref:autotransporter outer membrane beta-barrel domain-containing protein n=1 Tax=Candidatus Tisiphia endosymbiont of Micropterix aruncella TaxID=3066271 RepID=UPI003AA7C6FC